MDLWFIRGYLETYSFEIRDKFTDLLKKEWEDFYVDCYRSNKNLNVLVRHQVNAFIQELIPIVIQFIQDNLEKSQVSKSLITILDNWNQISAILLITLIDDDQKYRATMDTYSKLIKSFDAAAKHTIFAPTSFNNTE